MLDRASTFAHPQIVSLLKTRFVPVALDQAYQRRQKDAEGEFYRQIAGQGPRNNFDQTTQGFYVATPSGKLLLYNNNRDPDKLAGLIQRSLAEFDKSSEASASIAPRPAGEPDRRWRVRPPEGGLVVRVRAKVLDGYPPTEDPWKAIFQQALSRDNLWITREEHEELRQGKFPASLQHRIERFHLVDNTRGEPPFWEAKDLQSKPWQLDDGRLTGSVRLRTAKGERSYDAQVLGFLESQSDRVSRFDLVVLGDFQGQGRFTGNAPPGKFTLAIAFSLADDTDVADRIPPQGSRGWLPGYLSAAK